MRGVPGHRSLNPGESIFTDGDETVLLESVDRTDSEPCRDPVRTSCFNAETGPVAKLNLLEGGEAGVRGVDRPGDARGVITLVNW